MGKAIVIANMGSGQYIVRPVFSNARVIEEIAQLENSLGKISDTIEEQEEALALAESDVIAATDAVNAVIDNEEGSGDPVDSSEIQKAFKLLTDAASARDIAAINLSMTQARRSEVNSRLLILNGLPFDQERLVWCADGTDDLSGEVATAEVPGEGIHRIAVLPGFAGMAAYSAARDGLIHHREGMSPAQSFWNAAVLPGWQKWMPTYRVGTITAVNYDAGTCSVNLPPENSSAQNLPINQSSTLRNVTVANGVPIQYRTCDAAAFEPGDRVLVMFTNQDWNYPVVVGFSDSEPPLCPDEDQEKTYNWTFGWDPAFLTFTGNRLQYNIPQGGSTTAVTVHNPPAWDVNLSDEDKDRAGAGNFVAFARWSLGSEWTDPTLQVDNISFSRFVFAHAFPHEPLTLPRWCMTSEIFNVDGPEGASKPEEEAFVTWTSGRANHSMSNKIGIEADLGGGFAGLNQAGASPSGSISLRMKYPFSYQFMHVEDAERIYMGMTGGYRPGDHYFVWHGDDFDLARFQTWLGHSLNSEGLDVITTIYAIVSANQAVWIHRPRPDILAEYSPVQEIVSSHQNTSGSVTWQHRVITWARDGTW